MSEPLLTVWLPMPLADAGPILDAAIQDQLGRRVEVADAPVSRAEWRAFCEAKGREMPKPGCEGWGDDKPVTYVSRYDAEAFCEWAGVRLPTEVEWAAKIWYEPADCELCCEHVSDIDDDPDFLDRYLGFRVAKDVQSPYEPDTEHCWGIRLCMCLQEDNVRWTPLREACVIDLLEGRLFNPGQIVQRSVQVLSVNCPPEKAGVRLECWHVPAPHDEGAERRPVEAAAAQVSPFAERRYRPFFERFGESIAQERTRDDEGAEG